MNNPHAAILYEVFYLEAEHKKSDNEKYTVGRGNLNNRIIQLFSYLVVLLDGQSTS